MSYLYTIKDTVIGPLTLIAADCQLVDLSFGELSDRQRESFTPLLKGENKIILAAFKQIDEYFHHKRKQFTVPVNVKGTDFQKAVWNVLLNIPYGQTITYSDMGRILNRPNAQRAIGQACKANRFPIVIVE